MQHVPRSFSGTTDGGSDLLSLSAPAVAAVNEHVGATVVDLGDVIDFYNKAVADLPDHSKLKSLKLPGASVVLDRSGERFAEVFEENQRRVWVALAEIPEHV